MTATGGGETPETCTLCGASIRTVLTLAGQRWTVDAEPHPDGTVQIVTTREGKIRGQVLNGAQLPAQGDAHQVHQNTCTGRRRASTGPRCTVCKLPMDAELTRLEGWLEHPACDPTMLPAQRPRRSARRAA